MHIPEDLAALLKSQGLASNSPQGHALEWCNRLEYQSVNLLQG